MGVFDEFAWLAGWLEGEGSFVAVHRECGRPRIFVSAQCCDEDVIRRVAAVAGGHVTGPYERGDRSPMWNWRLGTRREVIALLHRIRPWMSERRQGQIDNVLELDAEMPLLRGATREAAYV